MNESYKTNKETVVKPLMADFYKKVHERHHHGGTFKGICKEGSQAASEFTSSRSSQLFVTEYIGSSAERNNNNNWFDSEKMACKYSNCPFMIDPDSDWTKKGHKVEHCCLNHFKGIP